MGYYTSYELFADGKPAAQPEVVVCDKCHGTGKMLGVTTLPDNLESKKVIGGA